jgi:hypothetical protein
MLGLVMKTIAGVREAHSPALLAIFPELARVRLRRGGLLPRIGGWCLGQSTVAGITVGRTVWLGNNATPSAELLLHELRHDVVKHTATSVVTIERFIIEEERNFPDATGELSGILYDMALAGKMIANKVRSAGLADILGSAGAENVQGEMQQKLDVISNEIIVKAFDHGGRLCAMASEEEPGIIQIPEGSAPASTSCCSIRSTARATST